MPSLSAPFHAANHEVIECRDRIGFRPEPHSACHQARVVVIQVSLAVEPSLDVIGAGCLPMGALFQSSFSDTVFQSASFTNVTSATGWPSFSSGVTLTTR